ncbi:unnamed protein product [Lota lota]
MTTRSEREKAQKLNEQHQVILSKMLREEENKYCADCEAKGPRWASWNLGVFMCIRCAGIHRNLGVHIARVKSVNLDQWTPEQIQSMVDMGNRRARQMYEAHLPESFRRPQTDQAMEVFIRDKYERKKYYDKDAAAAAPQKSSEVSPPSTVSQSADKNRQEREQEKRREEKKRDKDCDKAERPNGSKKRAELQSESRASPKKRAEPSVDLLGLDAPENSAGSGTGGGVSATGGSAPISDDLDIFGPMVSNPLPSSGNAQSNQVAADTANSSSTTTTTTTTTTKAEEKKTLSKDSILSLYATSSLAGQTQSQHQAAAGQVHLPFPPSPRAGMYMGQPQMQYAAQGYNGGMGGGAGMMPGMAVPNGGYMAMGQGMLPPGAAQGQGMYAMPQQPAQWNMNQMTQQMSAMTAIGGAGAGGAALGAPGAFPPGAPSPMAGWSPPPTSGQTLSTQLWK